MSWRLTEYNEGVTLKTFAGGLFYFDIPTGTGHVNSIISEIEPLKLGQELSLTYQLKTMSGDPGFVPLDGEGTANFRLMLQRKGDNMSGQGEFEHYRWWSNPDKVFLRDELDQGKLVFKVPVRTKHWTSVFGAWASEHRALFIEAITNVEFVQIVFGSETRFAHGIRAIEGKARFKVFAFAVA